MNLLLLVVVLILALFLIAAWGIWKTDRRWYAEHPGAEERFSDIDVELRIKEGKEP